MTKKEDEEDAQGIGSAGKQLLQSEFELERASEATENLKSTDWGNFFIATYGVGLVLSFFSVIILTVMLLLLRIISANTPTGLAFNLVTTAGTIISVIWFISHLLVRAVDTTVQQSLPYEKELRPMAEKIASVFGIKVNREGLHLLKAMVLGLSIYLLYVYRVSFVLDYSVVSLSIEPVVLVYWLLVFSLDLGYIGLFLTPISLGHNTLANLRG